METSKLSTVVPPPQDLIEAGRVGRLSALSDARGGQESVGSTVCTHLPVRINVVKKILRSPCIQGPL